MAAPAGLSDTIQSQVLTARRKASNLLPHIMICLNSPSLRSVFLATFRSVPYVYLGSNQKNERFNTRWLYLTAGYYSTVSLAKSASKMALSALRSGLHLGKDPDINYTLRKNWMETAYSLGSMGVSTLGTALPTLGVFSSTIFFSMVLQDLSNKSDQAAPSLPLIRDLYNQQKPFFQAVIKEIGRQKNARQDLIDAAVRNVDSHVQTAQTSDQLFEDVQNDLLTLIPKPPLSPKLQEMLSLCQEIAEFNKEMKDIIAGKHLQKKSPEEKSNRSCEAFSANFEAELNKLKKKQEG